MQNVFILTEHGNPFTKEGLRVLRKQIRKEREQTDKLCFKMGASLNDPKILGRSLVEDSIAVLSTKDRIYHICSQVLGTLKKMLGSSGNHTSWEVAKCLCEEKDTT